MESHPLVRLSLYVGVYHLCRQALVLWRCPSGTSGWSIFHHYPLLACPYIGFTPISSSYLSPWSDLVIPLVLLDTPSSGTVSMSLGTCMHPLASVCYNSWEIRPLVVLSSILLLSHVFMPKLVFLVLISSYSSDLISPFGSTSYILAGLATISMFLFMSVVHSMSIYNIYHSCILLASSNWCSALTLGPLRSSTCPVQ